MALDRIVRAAARLLVIGVATAAVAVLGALSLGTPAVAADSINCTPMGDPACRDLAPMIECVWVNTNGTRSVVWGYDNPSTSTLIIDVGNKNKMSPGGPDLGQPTVFLPGGQRNAFVTTISGTSLSWRLGNNDADLSSATAACATKPVPFIGNMAVLALYVLFVAIAIPLLLRARRPVLSVRTPAGAR